MGVSNSLLNQVKIFWSFIMNITLLPSRFWVPARDWLPPLGKSLNHPPIPVISLSLSGNLMLFSLPGMTFLILCQLKFCSRLIISKTFVRLFPLFTQSFYRYIQGCSQLHMFIPILPPLQYSVGFTTHIMYKKLGKMHQVEEIPALWSSEKFPQQSQL